MRIKFLDPITSSDDFKEKFCDMLDKLPFNIDDCMLSGVNLYFNLNDKETGQKMAYFSNGSEINCISYGFTKKKVAKEKVKQEKVKKMGKIIQFKKAD